MLGQGWQQARQSAGEQGLARARRSTEQQVVAQNTQYVID